MSLLHRRRSGRLWCSGEGSREGEKVLEKVLGIFGERPGQVRRVQQGFQRLASQQGKNKTLRLLGIPPKLIFLLIHNSRILHLGSNGEPFCTRKKESKTYPHEKMGWPANGVPLYHIFTGWSSILPLFDDHFGGVPHFQTGMSNVQNPCCLGI